MNAYTSLTSTDVELLAMLDLFLEEEPFPLAVLQHTPSSSDTKARHRAPSASGWSMERH